jgi:hypothetical protein
MEINPYACVEMVEEIIENKTDELKANKCSVDDIMKEVCMILELKEPTLAPVIAVTPVASKNEPNNKSEKKVVLQDISED